LSSNGIRGNSFLCLGYLFGKNFIVALDYYNAFYTHSFYPQKSVYHQGEKVTFTITLAHLGQPMDGAKATRLRLCDY